MLITFKGMPEPADRAKMDAAYRLRHDVFVDELGWENLRSRDRREVDQFDNAETIHFLLFDDEEIVGYQRLVPTTGRDLMSEMYPQLCEGDLPRDRSIFEWSRLAIKHEWRGINSMGGPTLEMVRTMVEWCLRHDVRTVLVATTPSMMLKFVQCHFRVEPLGLLQQLGGQDVIALAAHLDRRTLLRLDHLLALREPLNKSA